eukprot:1155771-Pelagomonas_calceolata.AAC.2
MQWRLCCTATLMLQASIPAVRQIPKLKTCVREPLNAGVESFDVNLEEKKVVVRGSATPEVGNKDLAHFMCEHFSMQQGAFSEPLQPCFSPVHALRVYMSARIP